MFLVSEMPKDVNKPRGKTTAYAFFVQQCREELKKKNPNETVVFSEFSKKCAEKWKVYIFSTVFDLISACCIIDQLLLFY